ncbi:hypothetical protein CSC2_05460 [Clostridium zeae]|uniref:Uncharacterized protein n=1 Tax=Clostridium zeae TaxID=2759022 RepID=A0ABQ1E5J3_9CLOT|nr:hypothetical protein CSC2_05460 [Clostridium zeae]
MPLTVIMLGTSFVNPSEYFNPTAQHTSKRPAIIKNNHFIYFTLLQIKKAMVDIIKYLPGFCPSVNTASCAFYLGPDQLQI